ncbi:SNF2-related protein, partial [Bacillus wiedmannii]|uniref:SNF2-related protein n=1 Tax=Bacillus wiedmannii TaxID=1890302 RepID=UPI000BEC15ED
IMLDESSMIKNEKSNRSKFILGLNAENVILLSGTPTGGKYEELWSQLHLLGWKINQKLFLKQFVVQEWDDRNSKYKITGYKNVERLKAKLKQYGAVFMKTEEVFDLPET